MRAVFIVPGGLDDVTGGNVYDAAAIAALRRRGWDVDVVASAAGADGDVVVVDSLAFGEGPPSAGRTIALVHQIPSEAAGGDVTVAERDTLLAADVVITVSRWLAARVRSVGAKVVEFVPPGRDRAWAQEGPRADATSVLCVANAFPGKGVADVVEAFDRAALRGISLEIVGDLRRDAAEAERVEAAIARASGPVARPGIVSSADPSSRYANAVAFVTASRYEGWPIAVAEAMASGLTVVGYGVPGVREVVGDAGVLVEPGDIAALGEALRGVLADPRLRAAIGGAARERALAWPTWRESSERFAGVAERLATQASGAENAP